MNNGSLGVDAEGKALVNLLELARENGRMTGLVTDTLVTDPTAAAFYAHGTAKDDRAELASTLAEKAEIDVVLGGGEADFLPTAEGGRRQDAKNLLLALRENGYDVVKTLEELDAVPRWRRAKLFGLFGKSELSLSSEEEGRGDQPTLADMVRRGIELLQFNSGGYLLVVDAGLMGRTARANNGKATLAETAALDRAISTALHYTGANSTIIVCGDVAIGGLTLNGFPERESAATEAGSSGHSWLTWATGPKGPAPRKLPNESAEAVANPDATPVIDEPAAIYMSAGENSASDVMAFGSGLGADALQGTLESTAIFDIIRDDL